MQGWQGEVVGGGEVREDSSSGKTQLALLS